MLEPLESWSEEKDEKILETIFVNLGGFRHFETITNIRT